MSSVDLVSGLHNIKSDDVLGNIYEIENALILLRDLDDKTAYYKGLKQHRAQAIDKELEKISVLTETLRSVIFNTIKQHAPDKKTVSFPSIGKVGRRKNSDTWQIEDESRVLSFLDDKGMKTQVIKEVREIVDKKQLTTVLDNLVSSGAKIPGAFKRAGEESVSITFDKEFKVPMDKQLDDAESPCHVNESCTTANPMPNPLSINDV